MSLGRKIMIFAFVACISASGLCIMAGNLTSRSAFNDAALVFLAAGATCYIFVSQWGGKGPRAKH